LDIGETRCSSRHILGEKNDDGVEDKGFDRPSFLFRRKIFWTLRRFRCMLCLAAAPEMTKAPPSPRG
jgi:hypothetical protein